MTGRPFLPSATASIWILPAPRSDGACEWAPDPITVRIAIGSRIRVMHPVYALALTALLGAQDPLARIDQETAKVAPAVTEIRHQIHQNPELSNREEKTAALIADYLRKLGLEVQTGVAHHGVVALLKGGLPGPVVAV